MATNVSATPVSTNETTPINSDTTNSNTNPVSPVPMVLPYAKPFPDVSNIEIFANENFKRWQERIFSLLDVHGVAHALLHAQPDANADNKVLESWQYANKVCRHTILQTLSNELFDVYCSCKEAKIIWEALIKKFTAEDATKQKFVVGRYYQWQMSDEKEMKVQINEYQKLLEDLKAEGITLPEKFVVGVLIEKLPDSWNDYKNNLKHKQTNFTMEEIVTHILIEDTNRKESFKTKELAALKANLVQGQSSKNKRTCVAIAGADYCVIAADTRMSTGYNILTRDYSKIIKLADKCVLASSGFQADVRALQKVLAARHLTYQHQHNKQMSCPAMGQLLSNTLYYKRFFPYYAFNVLGGLDNEGKGCVFTYDAVGSYERVGYSSQGSGATLIMPFLDNQLKSPSPLLLPAKDAVTPLSESEAIDLVKTCFASATERDIYTGDKLEMVILNADGVRREEMDLRRD